MLIPRRDQLLSSETERQQTNERLRVQFAQMANQVGEWIEQRNSRMTDIGMNARGTLEDQLRELRGLSEEINNYKEHIIQVDNLNTVNIYVFKYVGKWVHFEAFSLLHVQQVCFKFIFFFSFEISLITNHRNLFCKMNV